MKLTKEELKNIIVEELRQLMHEFKQPEMDNDILVMPDFQAAQAELLRQFSTKQRKGR